MGVQTDLRLVYAFSINVTEQSMASTVKKGSYNNFHVHAAITDFKSCNLHANVTLTNINKASYEATR